MRKAEKFTQSVTYHGEGPHWDAKTRRLLCMDVLAGDIMAVDLDGVVSRYNTPFAVTSVIRNRTSGGFIVATEHGLVAADEALSHFVPLAELTADQDIRTNDGGCDPYGAFVIGTMAYDTREGGGSVYHISPNHEVTTLHAPVSISNGVQWTKDGNRVYYIDTPTRRVDVFDVESGTGGWSNRRTHITVNLSSGFPDGMAIDEEDGVWVALWGAGAVARYDGTGRLVETINIPGVTQVSSCAFGGENRDILFVTTSRQGLNDRDEPSAGALFAVQTDSRGAIPFAYAG